MDSYTGTLEKAELKYLQLNVSMIPINYIFAIITFMKNSHSDVIFIFRIEDYVSKSKSVFLEDLQGLVKPELAFYICNNGDPNNKVFQTTHYSELTRYRIFPCFKLNRSSFSLVEYTVLEL